MDDYPAGSSDHNLPLLVVSGLTSGPTQPLLTDPDLKESSVLIRSKLPPVDIPEAKAILRYIQEADATALPWNGQDVSIKYKFKIRAIGRVGHHRSGSQHHLDLTLYSGRTSFCLRGVPAYLRTSRPPFPRRSCTHHSRR
jgi:hypothetical protein